MRTGAQRRREPYQPVILDLVVAYVPLVDSTSMVSDPQLYSHENHECSLERQLSVFFDITKSVHKGFRSAKDTAIPIQRNKSLHIVSMGSPIV